MSILGVIVRTRPEQQSDVQSRLRRLNGVDLPELAQPAADGRLVIVIEDTAERTAAATMAEVALWPEVLNTSLVYEYSGEGSPPPTEAPNDYAAWRSSLRDLAGPAGAGSLNQVKDKP